MFKENPENLEPKTENLEEKSPENQEQEINPEKLAEQKIQEMEGDFSGLEKNGSEGIEKANDSIGLDSENATQIAADLGVEKKNSGILEKAKNLLKNSKSAMQKLIAGGMATMAFSGGGDINTASAEEIFVDGKAGVSDTVKDPENYSFIDLERSYEIAGAKKELKKHIASQEYLEKLKIELDGDTEKAEEMQKQRLEYLKDVDIKLVPREDMGKEEMKTGYFDKCPDWLREPIVNIINPDADSSAFYLPEYHKIVSTDKKDSSSQMDINHELTHASMKYDKIPEMTKEKLKDSYAYSGNEKSEYFGDPGEILVRKQLMDLELEKMGVKEYGEKFTKEHIKKIVDLYKKGYFSPDVRQLIENTEYESYEKIFNEIASNEKKEDNTEIV